MKTDDLIALLTRNEGVAERAPAPWRWALAIGGGLLIGLFLIVTAIGMRPDIGAAMMPVMAKAAFAAAFAAAALPIVLRLARPGRPIGWRIGALGLLLAVAAIACVIALMGADPAERMRAWTGGGFPWCLVLVPVLATPTAAGLIWLVRGLAPTSLTQTGAAIGAAAGGVGAVAYAMYCPVDSVAFVTTWYSIAIGLCAALGAIVGARFLRW